MGDLRWCITKPPVGSVVSYARRKYEVVSHDDKAFDLVSAVCLDSRGSSIRYLLFWAECKIDCGVRVLVEGEASWEL